MGIICVIAPSVGEQLLIYLKTRVCERTFDPISMPKTGKNWIEKIGVRVNFTQFNGYF
jgi:hypothetical protein